MDPDLKQAADARFDEALAASGARDPREHYRKRLKELRKANPPGYGKAVQYYEAETVPSIAEGRADPIQAWTDFGARLAEICAPGRVWAVDATGRRRPYEPPGDTADMILHLPEGRAPTFVVALPRDPTPSQMATFDWLVAGRRSVRGARPAEAG